MIKRAIYIPLIFVMGLGLLGCATTADTTKALEAAPAAIESLAVQENAVVVTFNEQAAPTYTVYKPSDPYLVVVDLPGAELGAAPEKTASESEGITEVRAMAVEEPTPGVRLEVLLDTPATLEPSFSEGVLTLSLAGEAEAPEAEAPMEAAAPLEPATSITGIEFDYSNGRKRLVISADGSIDPDVFTLNGKIVIDVPDVSMATSVPSVVVPPVKAIRQGVYEDKIRLVVELREKLDFVSTVEGASLVLSFPVEELPVPTAEEMPRPSEPRAAAAPAPPRMAEEAPAAAIAGPAPEAPPASKAYSGKLISLDFQDADIKPIIRLLAGDVGGYNVVLHPTVSGKINLRLKDVPWDKALDIILKQNGLERQSEENIMWVAPASVFREQEEDEAKRKQTYEKVAELIQEVIHLDHIAAEDMKNRIVEAKLISARGQMRVDARTNSLIINDTEENIRKIKIEEIPYWDTPEHGTLQVLIEAKIVEVSTTFSRQLGIRWGATHTRPTPAKSAGDQITSDFGVDSPLTQVAPAFIETNILEVGSVSTIEVNLRLEALETMGKTRKLANPKVLTIDKLAATIKQGVQIPFSTIEDGTAKTEFKEAVLSLNVTPEIQPNGIIKLQVKANNDTPIQVGGETGINNQEISTQALVKDNETLVLGGIYTNTETELEQRIPWLGRIPILGWLFKTRQTTSEPKELLVFITPKVIK